MDKIYIISDRFLLPKDLLYLAYLIHASNDSDLNKYIVNKPQNCEPPKLQYLSLWYYKSFRIMIVQL